MSHSQETTLEELKRRQIAEKNIKIEQNAQYLTHLIRYNQKTSRTEIRIDQTFVTLRSIAHLAVQITYLLYSCHIKQISLYISKNYYQLHPQLQLWNQACIQYLLETDFYNLPQKAQESLSAGFKKYQFGNIVRNYNEYVLKQLNKLIDLAKLQYDRVQNAADKIFIKQFNSLEYLIKNYLQPKAKNQNSPRVVILALQQSEIFRQYSSLTKILNNSIFYAIRCNKNINLFSEISRIQSSLLLIKKIKKNFEQYYNEIEKSVEELIILFIESNILTIAVSINEQAKGQLKSKISESSKNDNTKLRQNSPGQRQCAKLVERKYFCTFMLCQRPIQQFNSQLLDQIIVFSQSGKTLIKQITGRKSSNVNQYMIEVYPTRGVVSVKYVSSIHVNIENSDLVMFQANTLSNEWPFVVIQIIQKVHTITNRKEKFIAFKTLSSIHIVENPLLYILIMIDVVMICAKVAEPQIKQSLLLGQSLKLEEVTKRINHLIRIFIHKFQRYYQILCCSSNSESKLVY